MWLSQTVKGLFAIQVFWMVDVFVVFQLQYGEPVIRRAVPLALAILSASNPQLSIIDTLSKLSHDNDAEVSHNSIFAMGIVGAGQLTSERSCRGKE